MNKKIAVIIALTVVALIVLSLYTFSPLNKNIQPQSKQVSQLPTIATESFGEIASFHNKDLYENYYTVGFPGEWQITTGKAGEYIFTFAAGNGSVQFMDVPDNSTLQLFILSQIEPKLKNSISGYQKKDFQKLSLNGLEAYKLVYQQTLNDQIDIVQKIFIAGPDQAVVMIFNTKEMDQAANESAIQFVQNSFNWEN